MGWTTSELWTDAQGMPSVIRAVAASTSAAQEAAQLLRSRGTRRIWVSGNGAAYYVGHALWLQTVSEPLSGVDVQAVPAGMFVTGDVRFGSDDALLAISSSGEAKDLIDHLERTPIATVLAVTSDAGSTIGRGAGVVLPAPVDRQESLTHTQGFAANLAATRLLAAALHEHAEAGHLRRAVERLHVAADEVEAALGSAPAWADGQLSRLSDRHDPASLRAAVAFGSGGGWTLALELALLLAEVAGVPAQGLEAREGATTGMYALGPDQLAIGIRHGDGDVVAEAERLCASRGAASLSIVAGGRVPTLAGLPASLALACALAAAAGRDVDRPAWSEAYHATMRRSDDDGETPA